MSWVFLTHQGKRRRVAVASSPQGVWVGWAGGAQLLRRQDRESGRPHPGGDEIHAPMTGKVVEVKAKAGSRVAQNELLVVMEAMKMEYRLTAPKDARVGRVGCHAGQLVDLGETLVVLEPIEGAP